METWRPVAGYEGLYEVSDLGRVRSVERVVVTSSGISRRLPGVTLRPGIRHGGHLQVALSRGGSVVSRKVHQLVLLTFRGSAPEGHGSRHLDGNAQNNTLANLVWGTQGENMIDRWRHVGRRRNPEGNTPA
jgi:hypothetical protein